MELSQFGWNAVTLGFVGTIFFTFFEGWGLVHQNRKISQHRSGESISVTWFAYIGALLWAVFIYGLSIGSLALIVNGLVLGSLHIPILFNLFEYKGFHQSEKALILGLVIGLTLMVLTPFKDWFFLVLSLGSILSTLAQPIEIWKNKHAGVVAIKLLVMYFISTCFWVVYGFAVNDWVLKIISPSYLAIFGLTIALWFKFPSRPDPIRV